MRLVNGQITKEFPEPIIPLRNHTTNRPIDFFPDAVEQVEQLPGEIPAPIFSLFVISKLTSGAEDELNRLLEALQGPTTGDAEQKKMRLRRLIGLRF